MRKTLSSERVTVFLTGIGGFLQNFLYGFGGIRLREDGLKVKPFLPDELLSITFKRIFFGGKAYRLTVERKDGQDTYELKERLKSGEEKWYDLTGTDQGPFGFSDSGSGR